MKGWTIPFETVATAMGHRSMSSTRSVSRVMAWVQHWQTPRSGTCPPPADTFPGAVEIGPFGRGEDVREIVPVPGGHDLPAGLFEVGPSLVVGIRWR